MNEHELGLERASVLRGLRQPDPRSCGASVLVAARILQDRAYAERAHGHFELETFSMHRRVTGAVDVAGRLQLPWPRTIGTPPWAVARQLTWTSRTRTRYVTRLALTDPAGAFDAVRKAVGCGLPVALFVGDRWCPRHVVLAVETRGGTLRCYEPSSGRLVDVTRVETARCQLGLAGWDRLWLVVGPD